MTSIEEIIAALQQAVDAVDNAVTACGAAIELTSELHGQMAASGVRDKAQELAAATDAIERYRAHLTSSTEPADHAIDLVKLAGG